MSLSCDVRSNTRTMSFRFIKILQTPAHRRLARHGRPRQRPKTNSRFRSIRSANNAELSGRETSRERPFRNVYQRFRESAAGKPKLEAEI